MSVVVAIKGKEGIVVGADKQVSLYHTKQDTANKISMIDYGKSIIGCVGYLRDANLLYVQKNLMFLVDILEEVNVDIEYVINKVVPNLFTLLRDNRRIKKVDGIESMLSQILYCSSNKIFEIYSDGCVIESEEYTALGCGTDLVMGYLKTLENLNTKTNKELKEIIETAIKKSCKDDIYINDQIDFLELRKE